VEQALLANPAEVLTPMLFNDLPPFLDSDSEVTIVSAAEKEPANLTLPGWDTGTWRLFGRTKVNVLLGRLLIDLCESHSSYDSRERPVPILWDFTSRASPVFRKSAEEHKNICTGVLSELWAPYSFFPQLSFQDGPKVLAWSIDGDAIQIREQRTMRLPISGCRCCWA